MYLSGLQTISFTNLYYIYMNFN